MIVCPKCGAPMRWHNTVWTLGWATWVCVDVACAGVRLLHPVGEAAGA